MNDKRKVIDTSYILNKNTQEELPIEEYDLKEFIKVKEDKKVEIDDDLLAFNLEQQIKELKLSKIE